MVSAATRLEGGLKEEEEEEEEEDTQTTAVAVVWRALAVQAVVPAKTV